MQILASLLKQQTDLGTKSTKTPICLGLCKMIHDVSIFMWVLIPDAGYMPVIYHSEIDLYYLKEHIYMPQCFCIMYGDPITPNAAKTVRM